MRIFHFCVPLKSPSCPLGLSEVQRSMEILGCSLCLEATLPSIMKCFWTCWECFFGFLSICCTARSVDAQCYTFCIHVITLHSCFQSQLLSIIFLNLHSTLLNIFYSVFFFLKKVLVFLLLEHYVFPKDFWSCSLNGMAMVFWQDPLLPCVGKLFHLNLLVFWFFKFLLILFLTILYKLYWFV